MTRAAKISIWSGSIVAGLLAVAAAGVLIARSDWFREKVRERIISEAAKATNGKVELGEFKFDWKTLTAELDNLTIHGTEPSGQAPLLHVNRLIVGLKIISMMDRTFNIARVEADAPHSHLIVEANGDTNIPPPHKLTPQMILDLKIGRFDLKDGLVLTESPGNQPVSTPWSARGENLTAHAAYNQAAARYSGEVSLAPLHFQWNSFGAVDASVKASLAMEKNRITVPAATITTAGKIPSVLNLSDVSIDGFTAPVATAKYDGTVSLDEIDRVFKLVAFQHTGKIGVSGTARFVSPEDYQVSGAFNGSGLGYGTVKNLRASGQFQADPEKILLSKLHVGALTGEITGAGEVRNFSSFTLAGQLEHFDVDQLISLTGVSALPWDGVLSGPYKAAGKLSERNFHDIVVTATAAVDPAAKRIPVHGELTGKFDGASETITFGNSWLALPASRLNFSGTLDQTLQGHLETQDLNELRPAIVFPDTLKSGAIVFDGTLSGPLNDPRLAGHATVRNANFEDQQIDSVTGDFIASNALIKLTNAAVALSGVQARGDLSIALSQWKMLDNSAVSANLTVTNGDLTKLLALAGWKDAPLAGTLTTTAQITGTAGDPHATANATASQGQIYGQPFDTATAHLQYLNSGAQTATAAVNLGGNRLDLTARFDHAPGAALAGKVRFDVSSSAIPLNRITEVHTREPDLRGTARIKAAGTVDITEDRAHKRHFAVTDLNGDLSATALAMGPRSFGDARVSAATNNGVLTATLDSNAVKASIKGQGTMRLTGDYPIDAKVTFSGVTMKAVETLFNLPMNAGQDFDGSLAGQATLSGAAKTPDLVTAGIAIDQFELHPLPGPGAPPNLASLSLTNDGPIRMSLAKSVVRVENARFKGPETNLDLSGSVALNRQSPLDLSVRGNVNLALAHTFNEDLTATGELVLNANVRGSFASPDVTGRAEMQKSEFRYADFVNGLTNVNGVFLFNGSRATIQSLTAETGGGKVDAGGFVALTAGLLTFRLDTKARGVRIRYPEGVSSLSDADLTLAGTSDRSEASGKLTIRRIAINPKSDAASMLETSSLPTQTAATRTGLAANMNLDIQIETAPDVQFETSVAQSVQADANLRLRGTATNRALLGRINITQGEIVFFGNKYMINQGSVSFLNPAKIDPILNISVETKSRGVDVALTISGPMNKLNVSYRSDPPLQFGDIVALLATGRAPSNATLETTVTGQSQNFQQVGASALLQQALSNPSQGRLQRFFGVSNIKLDPELSGITGSPEARLSIEQQVAPNILFTYVSDLTDTSTQLIRVELDFNPRWGAILTREENGYVGLDFAYKRRFK
ncbi:MAG TPA: translocation/assembly module TamB domain-containing protein [Bryobacteraceae bacterium]|nr:translocation/assembly module TamB domain-containing protein [Bryobacteraceae bacterium]